MHSTTPEKPDVPEKPWKLYMVPLANAAFQPIPGPQTEAWPRVEAQMVHPHTYAGLALEPREVNLTADELRMLRSRSEGSTNKKIAAARARSVATENGHIVDLLEKLDAHTTVEAITKMLIMGRSLGPPMEGLPRWPTDDQIETGVGIALGHTAVEIGAQRNKSKNTIFTTTKRLYRNLGVNKRERAARLMVELGFLVPVAMSPEIRQHLVPDKLLILRQARQKRRRAYN